MGIIKSTIYSTTASEAMSQLNFSTDFQQSKANVTIELVKSGSVVKTVTYNLDENNLIGRVSLVDSTISSEGTVTLATGSNSVVFSGVCVWGDVTSFRAENVAIAYR